MAESWTVNSIASLAAYHKHVDGLYAEHRYITFAPPRIGHDRSISQNSLFHVFLTEYAAHLLNKTKRDITKGILAGMKRTVKARFTQSHPDCTQWMTMTISCPMSGHTKRDYTSSKDWKRGEMFVVLTWLQMLAANDGLILESKGEFKKNQRIENGQ